MSMTFTKESDSLFVISAQGVLTIEGKEAIEEKSRQEIGSGSKVKLLVLADQFAGWGKEGDWGDLTFFHEYDSHIEKIAVVSTEKWKDEMLMYLGAGRRQAQVKFFFDDEEQDAREWLASESE